MSFNPPFYVPGPGVDPHPTHTPPSKRLIVVHWATWGMLNQAHFIYTQGPQRSQMFNTKPGTIPPGGMHADCSQFVASCYHWSGVPGLTSSDYTGTLLQKGKHVTSPKPGDCIVWGPGTGTHTAFYVGNGWTIGFGHSPGAPNRVREVDMTAWMTAHGHPGVRYLQFTA